MFRKMFGETLVLTFRQSLWMTSLSHAPIAYFCVLIQLHSLHVTNSLIIILVQYPASLRGNAQPWNSLWANFNEPKETWWAYNWVFLCPRGGWYRLEWCRSLGQSCIIQAGAALDPVKWDYFLRLIVPPALAAQNAISRIPLIITHTCTSTSRSDPTGKSSNLMAIVTFFYS